MQICLNPGSTCFPSPFHCQLEPELWTGESRHSIGGWATARVRRAVPGCGWAGRGAPQWGMLWKRWLQWKKQGLFFFFSVFKNLFILIFNFWLHWVFVAASGLSLVAAGGGYSLLWCVGFSLQWLLLLQSTGSRCAGFSSCGTWAQ